jgi:hypothetical protein
VRGVGSISQTTSEERFTEPRTPDPQVELIIEGEQIVSANSASRGGGISALDATLEVERESGNLIVRGNAAGITGGGLNLVGSRLVAWGNVSIQGNEVAGEGAQPHTPKLSTHSPVKYVLEPGRAAASHLIHRFNAQFFHPTLHPLLLRSLVRSCQRALSEITLPGTQKLPDLLGWVFKNPFVCSGRCSRIETPSPLTPHTVRNPLV